MSIEKFWRSHLHSSIGYALLWALSVVSIAIFVCANIWGFSHGFMSADEGWYMYIFNHREIRTSSHAHLLFAWVPILDDIFLNRLTIFVLRILATWWMCWSLAKYFRQKLDISASTTILLGLFCLSTLSIIDVSTIHYNSVMNVIVPTALALMFLSITYNRGWMMVACGIVLAFIFPTKATSMLIVPLALVVIWALAGWRQMLLCIAGGLIGLAFVVFIMESPSQIVAWIEHTLNQSTGSQYSGGSLISWLITALKLYFKWAFMGLVAAMIAVTINGRGFRRCAKWRPWLIMLLEIFVFIYLGVFAYPFPQDSSWHTFMSMLIWTVVIASVIYCAPIIRNRRYTLVAILMIFTPLCISFGTLIKFTEHHTQSYPLMLLMVAFAMPGLMGRTFRMIGVGLFLLAIGRFFAAPQVSFHGDVYAAQTVPVRSIGIDQNIKVTQNYINVLEFFRDNVPADAPILASTDSWGMVSLLGLECITPNFYQFTPEAIEKYAKPYLDRGEKVYLLCQDEHWVFYAVDQMKDLYKIETIDGPKSKIVIIQNP